MDIKTKSLYRMKTHIAFFIILLLNLSFITPSYAQNIVIKANGKNHVDLFHLDIVDGKPALLLSEDISGRKVIHKPSNTILEVSEHAYHTQIPKHFPGAPNAYVLPQTGDNGNILWPGWDTIAIAKAGYNSSKIVFENVQGPGQIYMYQSTLDSPVKPVLSNESIQVINGSQIYEKQPTHKHVTWTFTKPGKYTFTVSAFAIKNGIEEKAGTETYTINVDSKNENKKPSQPPIKKQECKKGFEKKLANDGNYYCVSQKKNNENAQTQPQLGKTCKPVLVQKQAQPGDKIKTIDTITFNVGSSNGTTNGHFDLGSAVINGEYTGTIKDDNQGAWVSPASRIFALSNAAKVTLPAGLDAIGEKGATVWMIDQTQKPSVPWIGVNTQHPTLLQNTTGNVTFQMNYVGPGRISIVEGTNFGKAGRILLGAGGGSSWTIPANTHTHPNWFFSAAGQYKVTITQTTIARTTLKWNELVGMDENGNECSVHLPQTVGKTATKTDKADKDKNEEEIMEASSLKAGKNFSNKNETTTMTTKTYAYYGLAGVGILALVVSAGIFIYTFRMKK